MYVVAGLLAVISVIWLLYGWLSESESHAIKKCESVGGVWEIDYFLPISTGKTVVMTPIYHCKEPT